MYVHGSTRVLNTLVMVVGLILVATPAMAAAPSPAWTKQFGSAEDDLARAVAVDGAGRILVVGHTDGSVTGWPARGGYDAFVRVLKPDGKKVWTKQFGTGSYDRATGVAVDGADRIYIVGLTEGSLAGTNRGSTDAFVRKIKPDGKKAWTRQFGTSEGDIARGVALDRAGNVYVTGHVGGSLKGVSKGGDDVFVRKYRPNGSTAWTRQFGSTIDDYGESVAVDRSGNVYVAGYTYGSLKGIGKGHSDVFVRKIKPNGSTAWTKQFGTTDYDVAWGVAVDRSGNVYVAGYTHGSLGGANKGNADAYVRKYKPNGATAWTRQFGTTEHDSAGGIAVDRLGKIYVAGETYGSLKGTQHGGGDAFVRKYRTDGSTAWTRQFGTGDPDWAAGVAVDARLRAILTGNTFDSVTGWPSRGGIDVFVRKYKR